MRIKGEIHARLSDRAYEALKDLEEYSGFSGSRLIEEIILAIDGVMFNFAWFELGIKEAATDKESLASLVMFTSAMNTILDRVGYVELYEEQEKEQEKEKKKRAKQKQRQSDAEVV